MLVLYIILGVVVGVPLYLLVNIFLAWIGYHISVVVKVFMPSLLSNSSNAGVGSIPIDEEGIMDRIFGWGLLIAVLIFLFISIAYRILWLVYQIFKIWLKLIRSCWRFGDKL